MIVDLTTLKDKRIEFDFSVSPAEVDLEDESLKLIDAVRIQGKLAKGIAQTEVEGRISSMAEVECNRCLQPVEAPLDFPFEAVFVTPENYTQEKEAELRTDDLEVAVLENDTIDLTELVREQILLNLPSQIFCREDCRGLCQKCGSNRNLIDCNCKEVEIDPRWSALKKFKVIEE